MEQTDFKEILFQSTIGYALHQKIFKDFGKSPSYVILDLNPTFERMTGLKPTNSPVNKNKEKIPRACNCFDLQLFYAHITEDWEKKEFIHFDKTLNKWFRTEIIQHTDNTFTTLIYDISYEHSLTEVSKQLIQFTPQSVNYYDITDKMRDISGARYVVLNVFDDNVKNFTTVAISGLNKFIDKAKEILGFKIVGKRWACDLTSLEGTCCKKTTTFQKLYELSGIAIPKKIIRLLSMLFNIDEVVMVKTTMDGVMVGNFLLLFTGTADLKNKMLVETYADMTGCLISRIIAEKKAAEQLAFTNHIMENVGQGLTVVDEKGKFRYVNKSYATLIGYTPEELIDKTPNDFTVLSDHDLLMCEFEKRKNGQRSAYENILIHKNGALVPVMITGVPNMKNNFFKGTIASVTDLSEIKKREEIINVQRSQFKEIIDMSPNLIFARDINGRYLIVNRSFLEYVGKNEQSVLGKTNEELGFSKHICQASLKSDQWIIRNQKPMLINEELIKKQGKDLGWFQTAKLPYNPAGLKTKAVLAISTDITKRKMAEEALRISEEKFRALVDQSLDMIYLHELDGKILEVNQAVEKFTGYSKKELLKMEVFDLHTNKSNRSEIYRMWHSLSAGQPIVIENEHVKKDATKGPVEISATKITIGHNTYILAMVRDIAQRKAIEKELLRTRDILLRTNRMAKVGGWEKNLITGEDYWSVVTKELHEVEPDYVPTTHDSIEFYKEGESRNKIREVVKHLINTGEPYDVEVQLITAKGNLLWIRTMGYAEFLGGKCIKIYGTFHDISEKKLVEENLRQNEAKLKTLISARDMLYSIIAHDLKNVFNGMLGLGEILAEQLNRQDFSCIAEDTITLNDLTKNGYALLENLLNWSRLQTDQLEFAPTYFDINEMILEAANLCRANLNKKNIDFSVIVDRNKIWGDSFMLETTIRNLLGNAIKYTEFGGKITIRVSSCDDHTLIAVHDTGVGLSPQNLSKLFSSNIHSSTYGTNNEKGTGLGLAICKEFVEKHGGRIWAESNIGKGSVFYFTIKNENKRD